jgi:copper(I)-binding protein
MKNSLFLVISLFPLIAGGLPPADAAEPGPSAGASVQADAGPLVKVEGAWIRSAVAGQQGTGAFMRMTAPHSLQLVGVATPVAGTAEIHEMKMEGDIMRMRSVAKIDLPSGQTVEFKPGGYHLMLMDLKQPLKPGAIVALTLMFRDAQGGERKLDLNVPVALQAPGASPSPDAHKPAQKH